MKTLKTASIVILVILILDMPVALIYKYFIRKQVSVETTVTIDGVEIEKDKISTTKDYTRKFTFVTNTIILANGETIIVENKIERIPLDHEIGIDAGYFMNTQMPYVSVHYSFKWVRIGISLGYSFEIKKIDYSASIGAAIKF